MAGVLAGLPKRHGSIAERREALRFVYRLEDRP